MIESNEPAKVLEMQLEMQAICQTTVCRSSVLRW